MMSTFKKFLASERGDTNFISIIIIIAIVIALAGVFYAFASSGMDTIKSAFENFLSTLGIG